MTSPILDMQRVDKHFGGIQALRDVHLQVEPGEIRALCGENGSGKSTALRVLSGEIEPDRGTVTVGGRVLRPGHIDDRIAAGVGIVFQDPRLCPDLSVAENIQLGRLPAKRRILNRKQMLTTAQQVLDRAGIPLQSTVTVRRLSQDQRHFCEVARVLAEPKTVLAFDETTASLTLDAVGLLFEIIRKQAENGAAVLFVSHRLEEIRELCHSVTVLRDGQVVDTVPAATEERALIRLMVGRSMEAQFRRDSSPIGDVRLQVRGVAGGRVRRPLNLDARAGEVVGLGGLAGSGRSTLLRLVFGSQRRQAGTVVIDGHPVGTTERDAIAAGLGYVPEDRRAEGLAMDQSVRENARLLCTGELPLYTLPDRKREQAVINRLFSSLSLKARSQSSLVRTLSGGNQQKIVLGRWLAKQPAVLLLDEPTRGVDVATKHEIYGLIHDMATAGVVIVMVSSELPELIGICDRIIVLREGAIAGRFSRGVTAHDLGVAMAASDDPAAAGTRPHPSEPGGMLA